MSIQYTRYQDNQILVRFNGIHRNITDDKEVIDEILDACIAYKQNPTEENADVIKKHLNPLSLSTFSENFDIDNNENLYLKGTKIALPEEMSELIAAYATKKYPMEPLINFWKLCLTNPNPEARDGFYHYVKHHGVVITDNGYAVLYKAVNVKGESSQRTADTSSTKSRWVNTEFLRIKGMKKSPKNYPVWEVLNLETGEMEMVLSTHKGEFPPLDEEVYDQTTVLELGTLQELYEQYIEESTEIEESTKDVTVFKPSHVGDHGMVIKVGHPVVMPREKCDPNIQNACSYGLHVGSYDYVSGFAYGMDSILAILVSPRDVVALPEHDRSKIRVCRYYPYAEMDRDEEGNWTELESEYFEEDFIQYEIDELESQLEDLRQAEEDGIDIDEDYKEEIAQRLVDLRD